MRDVALQLAGVVVVIVPPGHFLDQLLHLNIHYLVFLGDAQGILLLLGARRAHQDDALRSAWCISILQLKDSVDLFDDTVGRVVALHFSDAALADVLHSTDLQVVLEDCIAGDPLALLIVLDSCQTRFRLIAAQVPHHRFEGRFVALVQHDELVRYNTHLLQGNSLRLRPREAFDDPTLAHLLDLLNLLLHQFDDNLVAHVTVGFERLLDILTILLVFLGDLPRDQVSNGDALEVFALL